MRPTEERPSSRSASWAQPSLSRDFALLTAAILFFMLLISSWVAWITYIKHSERIISELEKETDRIELTLETEIQRTGHLLTAMGRQLKTVDPHNLRQMAQLMKSFDTGNRVYALWSWVGPNHKLVVSSNRGVLEEPVDVSDRDYVMKTMAEQWVLQIGTPIEGRVSNRWIIPVAMGISDETGEYIGTLLASIDIGALTDQISHIVKREGISFSILNKNFVALTTVSDSDNFLTDSSPLGALQKLDLTQQPQGVATRTNLFGDGMYAYYLVSQLYPYIILVGYDSTTSEVAIHNLLGPRLIQIAVVFGFLLSFLWIIRARVIKPVVELSGIAADVASGSPYRELERAGPVEIEMLSEQIARIGSFIAERQRLESELRLKISTLQQRLQKIQMDVRQRSVLLSGLLGEYKTSLRNINGFAQVLKDQLYGPIENKKYRQYAADIHQAGTTLELMVRKLIALTRVDSAALLMKDEELPLAQLVASARRFAQETLTGATLLPIHNDVQEQGTRLRADGIQVQQGLSYLMLYALAQATDPVGVSCLMKAYTMPRGEEMLVLLIGTGDIALLPDIRVTSALETSGLQPLAMPVEETVMDQLHLTLAQGMLGLQQISVAVITDADEHAGLWIAVHFPNARLSRTTEQ